ncbi:MAG: zinc-ribbon domain-containing protein [Chloroflexi bacterium]|nr:zinc-ribbon domain-containing protein [Chloroflexota bacterium]
MSAILIAGLAVVAIAFALYPLFKNESHPRHATGPDAAHENLLSQREATYNAIKDLEFDHAQGKISDADYATLREKYETKALNILAQLETLGKPIVKEDSRPLHLPNNGCPRCGEPVASHDKFCANCGNALTTRCSACGSALDASDKFCPHCGAAATVALAPA